MPRLSNVGPTLARLSDRGMLLFFKGHNNDYIWESRYIRERDTETWEDVGRVHDEAESRSWAFTIREPEACYKFIDWVPESDIPGINV